MKIKGVRTLVLIAALAGCEGRIDGMTGLSQYPGGTTGGGTNPSTATVQIVNFAFTPIITRVRPNGVVTWNWNSDTVSHNVTFSGTYSGRSSATKNSGTHVVTFPDIGQFNYTCTVHIGMNGTVIVQ